MFKIIALTSLAASSVVLALPKPATPAEPAPAPAPAEKVEKPEADPSNPYDVIFSKTVDLIDLAILEVMVASDEATIKKATEAIKAMQPKSDAIALEMIKLDDPSPEQQQALMTKWGPYYRVVMMQIMMVQHKLKKYPELGKAFKDLQPKPKKAASPAKK